MTDTRKKQSEPDGELLEFLGDIDEANDEHQDEDFSEYLANHDIEKPEQKPKPDKVKNE